MPSTECSYKVTLPDGTTKDLADKDELHKFLLSDEVSPKELVGAVEPMKETSIKNVQTKAERAERGLGEVEVEARRKFGQVFDTAKKMVDEGEIDPRVLAQNLVKKPRALTAEESAALLYDRMRLYNEHQKAMKGIIEASEKGDEGKETDARSRLIYVEDAINTNDIASRKTGYEQGLGLAVRAMMIRQDYTLANQIQRMRVANNGEPISESLKQRLEGYAKELEAAEQKLKDYEEQVTKLQQDLQFERDKNAAKKEKRATTKEGLKKERDELFNRLKEIAKAQRGKLSSNPIPVEMVPVLGRLVKNLVMEGLVSLDEVVDYIHNEIKDYVDGVSKRDVRDALSGYGKPRQLSKDEIDKQVREIKRQGRLVSALEDAQAGERPKRSGLNRDEDSPRVRELKRQIEDAMRENGIKIERKAQDPEKEFQSKLDALKKRLKTQLADYEERIKNKDFAVRTRKEIQLDQEALNLKGKVEAVKRKFDTERLKLEKENRSKTEKLMDFLTKWHRMDLLSGITTLGKLTTAAQERIILTPIEESIGAVLGQIPGIKGIAKQAAREGGFDIRGEARAISQYWDKATYRDMWDMIRKGQNPMELIYGKKYDLPAEAIGFFGQLHGALKVLPKRAEFFRSMEKRMAWRAKNGFDVLNPLVQAQVAQEAYNDAARAIFMQDNPVSDAYKIALNYLDKKGFGGKATAFVLRNLLPIVKVPTNIVDEATSYAAGGLKAAIKGRMQLYGGIKLMMGLKSGIEQLNPDQADYIMRNLKKQTMGAAFLALGYFNAGNVGGYYMGQRDPEDVDVGGLRIFGVNIPRWMVHNPALEMLQLGATIRRVKDKYQQEGKEGENEAAFLASLRGLGEQVPFVNTPGQVDKAIQNEKSADKFMDEFIKNSTIPVMSQEFAKWLDTDADGKPIKRYPVGLGETLKTGIPGLRKQVPDSPGW